MRGEVRVAQSPSKPILVYDGDCHFCSVWIGRWRQLTGDAVDYLPAQDPVVAARFPEIPPEQFAAAVQLIGVDGAVVSGAEAVLRTLAMNPRWRWLLVIYDRSPLFARVAEGAYRFVADHRPLFSRLTRAGRKPEKRAKFAENRARP